MENPGFKFGFYGGLGAMLFTLVMYNVHPIGLFNGLIAYLVPIGFYAGAIVLALNAFVKKQEAPITFRDVMRVSFPALLLAMGLNHLLHYLLLSMDPTFQEIHMQGMVELAQNFGSKLYDEQGVQGLIQQIEKIEGKRSFGQAFNLYFRSILPGFLLAAAISIFYIRRS
ncbi:MAG: DUF4199 family protein [Bacteroidota bacterium]